VRPKTIRTALLCAFVLVVGCTSQPATAPTSPDSPANLPALTREATLHLPIEPETLDPARAVQPAALDLLGMVMEGLVWQGEGATTSPGVAESWASPDGRTFTFTLRPDARWTDGRNVTAADFQYAWLRVLDPLTASDHAHLFYEIKGAEAWNGLNPTAPDFAERSAELRRAVQIHTVDDRTLQVELRAPDPAWPTKTAHPAFFPQRADQTNSAEILANGPFRLVEWIAGKEIRLQKNVTYWDSANIPLESLRVRIEPDALSALRLMELGQIDLAYLPGPLAEQTSGAEHMAQPATMGIALNMGMKALTNPSLRWAIHLTIDRTRLLAALAPGTAMPAGGLVPPSLLGGWSPASPLPPEGDPLQARRLWEKAKSELGTDSLTLHLLHAEEATELAQAVQLMLQENLDGLAIELEALPFPERLERVRIGQYDMVLQGWVAEHNDPASILAQFVTDSPANDPRWVSPVFDQALARSLSQTGDRIAGLHEAEEILLSELPVVPLYHPVRHWLVGPRLKGLRHRPLGARLDVRRVQIAP